MTQAAWFQGMADRLSVMKALMKRYQQVLQLAWAAPS